MSTCKNHDDLNKMTRWMADMDKIRDELLANDQGILAQHMDSIAADLEYQARTFTGQALPEFSRYSRK